MSLFTIEQVELIRRLRATGVTKAQVLDAFDQLDRLEDGHAGGDSCRVGSNATKALPPVSRPVARVSSPLPQVSPPVHTPNYHHLAAGSSARRVAPALQQTPPHQQQTHPQAAHQPQSQQQHRLYTPSPKHEDNAYAAIASSLGSRAPAETSFGGVHTTSVNSVDMQQQMADDMPTAAHTWRNIKSRFIFRRGHLQILEQEFKMNQYPDAERRREIAEICNTTYSTSSNKVTPMVVLNWFSNKRKAIRNQLKEQELTGGAAPASLMLHDVPPSAAAGRYPFSEGSHAYDASTSMYNGGTNTMSHSGAGDKRLLHHGLDVSPAAVTVWGGAMPLTASPVGANPELVNSPSAGVRRSASSTTTTNSSSPPTRCSSVEEGSIMQQQQHTVDI